MTEIKNKPYLMAILSGVAYKEPEDANKTFEKYVFIIIDLLTKTVLNVILSGMILMQLLLSEEQNQKKRLILKQT